MVRLELSQYSSAYATLFFGSRYFEYDIRLEVRNTKEQAINLERFCELRLSRNSAEEATYTVAVAKQLRERRGRAA